MTTAMVSLWMFHDETYTSDDRLQVQIDNGSKAWTNVGAPISRNDGSSGWKQHTVDLSAYASQTVYLGFLAIGEYGNDVNIDDIIVQEANLPVPTNVVISGMNISWDDMGVTAYRVYGADSPAGTYTEIAHITGTSYTYTGTENMKFFYVVSTLDVPAKPILTK